MAPSISTCFGLPTLQVAVIPVGGCYGTCYLHVDKITDILSATIFLRGLTYALFGYHPNPLPYVYLLMVFPLCISSYTLTMILGFSQQPLGYLGTYLPSYL